MYALVQNATISRIDASEDLLIAMAGDGDTVLPVIENKPDHDPATQILLGPVYTFADAAITASYTVANLSEGFLYATALDRTRQSRSMEYVRCGCTIEALVEALVEAVIEDRPDKLNALQAERAAVKAMFPKPAEPAA